MSKLLAISDTYIPSALMEQGFGPLAELGVAVEVRSWEHPTLVDLQQAGEEELPALRRAMGGSYGYTLGNVSDDGYRTPRNRLRQYFALLADYADAPEKMMPFLNR